MAPGNRIGSVTVVALWTLVTLLKELIRIYYYFYLCIIFILTRSILQPIKIHIVYTKIFKIQTVFKK